MYLDKRMVMKFSSLLCLALPLVAAASNLSTPIVVSKRGKRKEGSEMRVA
jgi:hypothetical protein